MATQETTRCFDFALDDADVIASVSPAWLAFAAENGAPELTAQRVLGAPLWDFVAGDETRHFYELLFSKVRRGTETVGLPFRCDSADRFRFMHLTITPREKGTLGLRGVLLREQPRPYLPILDMAFPRSESSLSACSLCKRVLAFGLEWLEPEEAVARLGLFDSPALPRLAYVVCDACRSRLHDGARSSAAP